MTAPTFAAPGGPPKDDDWSSLEDGSFDVPSYEWSRSQAGYKPAPDKYAKTDTASGVSLGSGASTTKTVNQVAMFKCDHCRGSGRFVRGFHNPIDYGPCNKCKGTGKLKTDPETRAKQKRGRVKAKQAAAGAYIEAHVAEYTWVTCNMERFGFASSMMTAFRQYGPWTENQLAAIRIRRTARSVVKRSRIEGGPCFWYRTACGSTSLVFLSRLPPIHRWNASSCGQPPCPRCSTSASGQSSGSNFNYQTRSNHDILGDT